MTSKERVRASFEHRQPDRTPYQISFTQRALEAMVAHCGDDSFLGQIDNCLHSVHANAEPLRRQLDELIYEDEFGVRWDRSIDRDIGNVCSCVIPERDLDGVSLPDPHAGFMFEGFAEQVAAGGDRFVTFSIGFSLFERAWTMRGMENLLLDMIEAPAFVDELFDLLCEYNLALIERAVGYEIDGVHLGDDWGSQRGLIMGPRLWEGFIAPRLERMYGAARAAGRFVSIHSCGKVQELFPRLVELGLNCFNPFQPEVMDVFEMKRLHGDRLSFWGGVSTQQLLPYGTPEQVRAQVRRLIAEVGASGGYILAPAHAIPADARPENVLALIEAANDQ